MIPQSAAPFHRMTSEKMPLGKPLGHLAFVALTWARWDFEAPATVVPRHVPMMIIITYSIKTVHGTFSEPGDQDRKGTTKNSWWETSASFRPRNQEGTSENLALNRTRWGDHGTNAYYHISPAFHVAQYSTVNNALGDFGYLSFVFTTFMLIEATTPPPRWRNRGHEPLVSVKITVDKRITIMIVDQKT